MFLSSFNAPSSLNFTVVIFIISFLQFLIHILLFGNFLIFFSIYLDSETWKQKKFFEVFSAEEMRRYIKFVEKLDINIYFLTSKTLHFIIRFHSFFFHLLPIESKNWFFIGTYHFLVKNSFKILKPCFIFHVKIDS